MWEKEIKFAQKHFKSSQDLYALVWRKNNNKLTEEDKRFIEELRKDFTLHKH